MLNSNATFGHLNAAIRGADTKPTTEQMAGVFSLCQELVRGATEGDRLFVVSGRRYGDEDQTYVAFAKNEDLAQKEFVEKGLFLNYEDDEDDEDDEDGDPAYYINAVIEL